MLPDHFILNPNICFKCFCSFNPIFIQLAKSHKSFFSLLCSIPRKISGSYNGLIALKSGYTTHGAQNTFIGFHKKVFSLSSYCIEIITSNSLVFNFWGIVNEPNSIVTLKFSSLASNKFISQLRGSEIYIYWVNYWLQFVRTLLRESCHEAKHSRILLG